MFQTSLPSTIAAEASDGRALPALACLRTTQLQMSVVSGKAGDRQGRHIVIAFRGRGGPSGSHAEINARLERLESLLERAVSQPAYPPVATRQPPRREPIKSEVVDSKETAENSASPKSTTSSDQILAADAYDGTLLVENGQSHFVSSLHWALLTDEVSTYPPRIAQNHFAHVSNSCKTSKPS